MPAGMEGGRNTSPQTGFPIAGPTIFCLSWPGSCARCAAFCYAAAINTSTLVHIGPRPKAVPLSAAPHCVTVLCWIQEKERARVRMHGFSRHAPPGLFYTFPHHDPFACAAEGHFALALAFNHPIAIAIKITTIAVGCLIIPWIIPLNIPTIICIPGKMISHNVLKNCIIVHYLSFVLFLASNLR